MDAVKGEEMRFEWWAHRGSGKGELENTLKGFEIAFASGFRAVEFDVMLSADGVPMVHHDWRVGRCAQRLGAPQTKSDDFPFFNALSSLDLANYRVSGEPVPTLSEVIHLCLARGLQANVELKAANPSEARLLGQAVLAELKKQTDPALDLIRQSWVFSSFYHASLLPLTGWPLALLYEQLPENWTIHASALQVDSVHLHVSGATAQAIRRIHTTGRAVRVYTVNDLEVAQHLYGLGVLGLFTDRMDFAQHSF